MFGKESAAKLGLNILFAAGMTASSFLSPDEVYGRTLNQGPRMEVATFCRDDSGLYPSSIYNGREGIPYLSVYYKDTDSVPARALRLGVLRKGFTETFDTAVHKSSEHAPTVIMEVFRIGGTPEMSSEITIAVYDATPIQVDTPTLKESLASKTVQAPKCVN